MSRQRDWVRVGAVVVVVLALGFLGYRVLHLEGRLDDAASGRPPSGGGAGEADDGGRPGGGAAGAEALARLSKQVAALSGRVDALAAAQAEGRPAAAVPAAGGQELAALRSELARLRKDVDALRRVTKAEGGPELAPPEIREAVADLVDGELERREQAEHERHRAIGEQVLDGIVQDFAERAGLSDQQLGTLYPVLQQMQDEMRTNWRAMRDGEKDFAEVRAAMDGARERLDRAARDVLSDDQYRMYEEEVARRFAGRGGFFR